MLFKIQNLGVVKETEMELSKNLILLCGYNIGGVSKLYDILKKAKIRGFNFVIIFQVIPKLNYSPCRKNCEIL